MAHADGQPGITIRWLRARMPGLGLFAATTRGGLSGAYICRALAPSVCGRSTRGLVGSSPPNSERARSLILAGQGLWSLFYDELRCSTRPMTEQEESRLIRQLIERLVMRFPQLPAKTVEKEVRSVHHGFQGAPLRDFVPLLVEHDVVISLKVLAGRAHRSPEQQATPA